jgi:arginyl-tRNA synthetase
VIDVRRCRDRDQGDYFSTIVLQLGKGRELAAVIAERVNEAAGVERASVAGPGFLNVRLTPAALGETVRDVLKNPVKALPEVDDAARYAKARGHKHHDWTRANFTNPLYLVQFAGARAAAVRRQCAELGLTRGEPADFRPEMLVADAERTLLTSLAGHHAEPRHLEELAGDYHRFFGACRIVPQGGEPATDLHRARLWLNDATRTVIVNGLTLLGVSAPERM